jgi:hypothetical protein
MNEWIDEERRFLKKVTMVYERYLAETHPGYDETKDALVDALATYWQPPDGGWTAAKNVVTKWLKPTLARLKKERKNK